MKLSFFRVHSLFLTGTTALGIAIAYPLVGEASTVINFVPRNDIISNKPDSILIGKPGNTYTQKTDNPPKDESAGGSR
ncbi:hypothetical protein [Kamptonema sp. UHCC 0994]|uniref:hypothetical protein n=1 Tax=Kamptonema sp. UHCC 0994 TaxID=3031329 RepID=UPI0023B914F0|nr:hypothetical protein [Kamptonema sp. UHCC 0994]MDF0554612.1 hypothetical protein [Kamptonema sp. UHCC 0994]